MLKGKHVVEWNFTRSARAILSRAQSTFLYSFLDFNADEALKIISWVRHKSASGTHDIPVIIYAIKIH